MGQCGTYLIVTLISRMYEKNSERVSSVWDALQIYCKNMILYILFKKILKMKEQLIEFHISILSEHCFHLQYQCIKWYNILHFSQQILIWLNVSAISGKFFLANWTYTWAGVNALLLSLDFLLPDLVFLLLPTNTLKCFRWACWYVVNESIFVAGG